MKLIRLAEKVRGPDGMPVEAYRYAASVAESGHVQSSTSNIGRAAVLSDLDAFVCVERYAERRRERERQSHYASPADAPYRPTLREYEAEAVDPPS